ncbi:TPA: hypothetical protein EYP44_01055 [Candidatus Bathyarchaeota archaeon]|nr:hypothetical protein [Candidatus Bathyarchaeota archaeon]
MPTKPVGRVIRDLKRRYDRKPRGWRFLTGVAKGHYDTFILHDGTLWQIKTEPLSPFHHVGFGGVVARSIDEEIAEEMQKGAPVLFRLVSPQDRHRVIVVHGIERYSSESISGLKALLSPRQLKLDLRLRKELDKLMRRKYGYRMEMYG